MSFAVAFALGFVSAYAVSLGILGSTLWTAHHLANRLRAKLEEQEAADAEARVLAALRLKERFDKDVYVQPVRSFIEAEWPS
jgi:hypothetical protein